MISRFLFNTVFTTASVSYATLCLAVGLLASAVFRRNAARAHSILLLAMIGAILAPVTAVLVRHYDVGILAPESPASAVSTAGSTIMSDLIVAPAVRYEAAATDYIAPPATAQSAESPAAAAIQIPWRRLVTGLYLLVSLAMFAKLVRSFLLGRKMLRKTTLIDSGPIHQALCNAAENLNIERPIELRAAPGVRSPLIWCWSKRPALLIPANPKDNCDWPSLFRHELAHLRRRDHITALFAETLICVFPWHPLLWAGRRRLLSLSEHACDDWALETAPSNTGYASLLLDMVPQPQMTLAPTILPSGRHLASRIRRIVAHKSASPRIGRKWAMLAAVAAGLLIVALALVQPRSAQAEEARQIGRGESLPERVHKEEIREREEHAQQLQRRAKEIESEIRELPKDDSERMRDLRAELREIREQLAEIKRDTRNIERDRGVSEEKRLADPRRRELIAHQRELQEMLQNIKREMKGLGEDHPERKEMDARLREVNQQLRKVNAELQQSGEMNPERRELLAKREEIVRHIGELKSKHARLGDGHPERKEIEAKIEELNGKLRRLDAEIKGGDRPLQVRREREVSPETRELMEHLRGLVAHADQIERELAEHPDHPEADQLHAKQREIGDQIRKVEQELRARQARGSQETANPEIRELMQHRRELQERAEKIERELTEHREGPEAKQLMAEQREIGGQMQRIEEELRGREIRGPREPADADVERRERIQQRREIEQRIEEIERKLRDIGDGQPDLAHDLRMKLDVLAEQREALQRPVEIPRQDRLRERGDIGGEVDRLRGEVNELRNQMSEIRGLLEELLEQRRRSEPRDELRNEPRDEPRGDRR
ncbi:MAG: hypothetical protein JW720_06255 [Sedimentisphaerales bacterium]|nr:hypothetical protein [Sedimentisphaerales bacterium]